jgi:apolipoprotein N-acyltransferase
VNLRLSLVSALLLVVIFPRFGWTWLAPIALTPILVACAREASWRLRFLYGWIAGAIFWGSICYWIQFVLEVHGGMGRWGGWGTFLLFAVLKGLHLGLFAMLAGFLMPAANRPRAWALPAVAALWTGIERTHGPLGFAWLDLGNAGIDLPLVARLAPVLGVYGLSFVFAMTGCAAALLVLRRPPRELAWLAALAGVFVFPALPSPGAPEERVLVVQPNIDTKAEWTVESFTALERRLALLSRAPGVNLIVWPEAPAPFLPSSPSFREFIAGVARASNANFLLSAVPRNERGEPLNSALMLDASGAIVDRYDKIKLVPFGEFVPAVFGWVNRITSEAGDFAAGNRIVVFSVNGHKTAAFICYESAFPDLVREFTRAGAGTLMNLSNDGYFGPSAAREQHLAIVRMRAAENRRWILRATNDGITAMIDPAGRVTDTLPEYRAVSATMRFAYVSGLTPYVRYGDWFAWGCLVAGVAGAARNALRGRGIRVK